eukprot:7690097-Heterocapsa_arctica.AAC.1
MAGRLDHPKKDAEEPGRESTERRGSTEEHLGRRHMAAGQTCGSGGRYAAPLPDMLPAGRRRISPM